MKTTNSFKTLLSILVLILFLNPITSLAQEEEEEDGFTFGGAMRYNILSTSYESDPTTLNTNATWDTWRLNVDGTMGGVDLSFEYRFYPTFNTHFIHHGYLGYDFSDDLNLQLGVTQVPFGNLTFNSHSWWFLTPYYVGLEDDYDMGFKFDYNASDNLNIKAAYFRQAEPTGPAYGQASFGGPGAGTYSYNIIPDADGVLSDAPASIRELNQFNVRIAYMVTEGTEIGFSGQMQGIHNSDLDETEYGHAIGAHMNSDFSDFNLKLQYVNYDYAAKNDDGETLDRVQMGAYGDPYYGDGVAARANILSAGIAYSIPVEIGPITNIQPYIDYSLMTKDGELELGGESYDFADSHMLVPGFMITAGSVYTYVDFAMGKNHAWLTDNFGTGFGAGQLYQGEDEDAAYYTDEPEKINTPVPTDDMDWNLRFNINLGYYF
ncbi:MAG: hypothetical protein ACLFNL_08930 [Bacteroidales bacterium]